MALADVVQDLVNGIALGGQYALLALGLAVVFSVLGLINFAHGELITIPSYAMLGLYSLGAPWLVMVAGALVSGPLAAVLMERIAFRPVRNADATTMLLTSFGVVIVVQSLLATFVSARPKAVPQPEWLSEAVSIAGISLRWQQILAIVITAVALFGMRALLKRSFIGIAMQAAAQDFDATRLMGIKANRVISATFAISGLLAAAAAVIYLARSGTVQPTMGLTPVLFAFVATVLGGIGDLRGAVAGGFLLGIVEALLRSWLPADLTGYTPAFLFAAVATVLILRPQGLFKPRSAVRV